MTRPEDQHERDQASAEVQEALARAKSLVERGNQIGAKWRQSRTDNNFRQMLRGIGKVANDAP